MYKFLIKYFYSWYILPLVILHELTHIFVGFLMGFKLNKFKIYKMKGDLPIWNGFVNFKFKPYSWKWKLTLYAPLLLIIPILLSPFNTICLFVSIYFITTIFFYKGKFFFLVLPSKGDIRYKRKIEYYTYIVKNTTEKKFNHYLKVGKLDTLIKMRSLLTEKEYFNKQNKK